MLRLGNQLYRIESIERVSVESYDDMWNVVINNMLVASAPNEEEAVRTFDRIAKAVGAVEVWE